MAVWSGLVVGPVRLLKLKRAKNWFFVGELVVEAQGKLVGIRWPPSTPSHRCALQRSRWDRFGSG